MVVFAIRSLLLLAPLPKIFKEVLEKNDNHDLKTSYLIAVEAI